jgi:hypothetical protein
MNYRRNSEVGKTLIFKIQNLGWGGVGRKIKKFRPITQMTKNKINKIQ